MTALSLPTQETRDDGTVRVAVERPVDLGFDHAECFLPAVKWFNVEGFTDDPDFLDRLRQIKRAAHFRARRT